MDTLMMTQERQRKATKKLTEKDKQLRYKLGQKIMARRQSLDVTQVEVARSLHLDYPSYVSQLENGRGKYRYRDAEPLARILRLEPQHVARVMVAVYEPDLYKILYGATAVQAEINTLGPIEH